MNAVSDNLNLANLDAEAKSHSEKVSQFIADEIAHDGPISFKRFMELALYAPGLGYYSAGAHKLGREGDFVTAPEISVLFSNCVANKCAEVLSAIDHSSILELGAGSGKMVSDILHHLKELNCMPENYYILEVSADLKERQKTLLKKSCPDFFEKIIWLDVLPENFNGIILANEVVDALPVHRFKVQDKNIFEVKVDFKNGQFIEVFELADKKFQDEIGEIDFPENYESEINMVLASWVDALAKSLIQGEMLFVDYGFPQHEYYHPQRNKGTLMCHFQHQAHDNPYVLTGVQDITAHVNFTQLINALESASCNILNYDTQANFLINYGLIDELQRMTTAENHLNLAQQVKILTLPSEMGELFKVLVAAKAL